MRDISAGVVTGRKDEVTERAVLGTRRAGRGLFVCVPAGHSAALGGNRQREPGPGMHAVQWVVSETVSPTT